MLTRPYNFMLFTRTSEIKLHGKFMEGTLFSDVALIFFLMIRDYILFTLAWKNPTFCNS